MATPFVVWLLVGILSIVALLAVLLGLIRHVMVLLRSLGRFQRDIAPIAEDLSAESARAAERASRRPGERPFGRS
jgi:hypothetical protein